MSTTARDPREIITEESFKIAPELLGLPLARPWRRAAAMAIDGVLVAILANAPGVLFGIAAALVLFRITPRSRKTGYVRLSLQRMLRFAGAVVAFAVAVDLWGTVAEGDFLPEGSTVRLAVGDSVRVSSTAAETGTTLAGLAGLAAAGDIVSFRKASTEEQARDRAQRVMQRLRQAGASDDDIRDVLEGISDDSKKPWLAAGAGAVASGLAQPDSDRADSRGSRDSLAVRYAAALAASDVARADSLRPALVAALARDTLSEMEHELAQSRASREKLQGELEEAQEEPHFLGYLKGIADDLGLGFGWTGLYFTASVALWRGRTPGKRLLRTRVIRLDGKPLGWWASFERFGGYAAGLFTGLLGFAQVIWDRNRQAIHDKISETVVVIEK